MIEELKVVGGRAGEKIGEINRGGMTWNIVLNNDEHIGHDIIVKHAGESEAGFTAWLFCHCNDRGIGCGHEIPATDWNAEFQCLTN